MYKSKYYEETKADQKDSITSGALTTGIICTVIVVLFTFLKMVEMYGM